MAKPFVPFDKFERSCQTGGKTLAETMQDSTKASLAPEPEKCSSSCLPYWQRTGERRCMEIDLIEVEETDGCGHTRWVRTADRVIWEDAEGTEQETTRCDTPNNRIQKKQVNQCGGVRWITTNELCCKPEWVNVTPAEIDCTQSMERRLQRDGCGNERLRATGSPVDWVATGEQRCQPGNVYQVEETNQCGDVRWRTVPGGCPCIPNWQTTGQERCTGEFVEQYQTDGCGHNRWQPTSTLVVWTNTGETRCNGGFIQNQQISQCGSTRWSTTETTCTSSPPPVEIDPEWSGDTFSDGELCRVSMRLDGLTGRVYWKAHLQPEESAPWVTGAFERSHYEARITFMADESHLNYYRERAGTTLDTWFNLADVPVISNTLTCRANLGGGEADYQWTNAIVVLSVRKVGEATTGGMSFGPFIVRAT